MPYIKFLNSGKKYQAIITQISDSVINVKNAPQNLSGFNYFLDNDEMVGNYQNYNFLYLNVSESENFYSNDGSVAE